MVHTGSRGLGYQVCDDFIRVMIDASRKYNIELPDRQLCCTPINSPEGKEYLAAMACAANYAFANRQMITHWVRESFESALHVSPKESRISLVYDVCHNIAKFEEHIVDGQKKRLCVHRKGATRAFPPNHPDTPGCIQIRGATRINTGRHGTMFLCAGRHREGIFRYLRQHMSWGGEGHEQKSGDEDSQGTKHCPGTERKGILVRPTAVPHWTKSYLRHTRT